MTEVTPSIKVYDEAQDKWVFVASGGGTGGGGPGVSDHADLAGLTTGNDHPQYLMPSEVLAGTNVTVTQGSGTVTIAAEGGEITGAPAEGALVSWDGANRAWVIPEAVDAADIPYNETSSIAQAIAALTARVTALETTGPPVVNTTRPSISGTYQAGQTITTSDGEWAPTPDSFTYQWRRSGVPIAGQTSATYALVTADIGTDTVTCAVTATKAGYSSGLSAADPIDVTAAAPVPMTVVGAASQGAANSSTTRTVTCPAGIDPGDLIILVSVSASGAETQVITGITGLTEKLGRQVSGHDARVWTKTAAGDEDNDVITCTVVGALKVSMAVIVLRSASGNLEIKQIPFGGSTGGNSAATPTVIATQASYELALGITSTGDATTVQTITMPSGHTLVTSCISTGTSGGRTSIVASYPTLAVQNSGVTLGGDTIDWTPGSAYTAATVAIGLI